MARLPELLVISRTMMDARPPFSSVCQPFHCMNIFMRSPLINWKLVQGTEWCRLNLHANWSNFSITAVQRRNHELIEQKAYLGMHNLSPSTMNVRYHLLPSDNATLYRKFSRRSWSHLPLFSSNWSWRSLSVFQHATWRKLHGRTPIILKWFLMGHLAFAHRASSSSLHSSRMRTEKEFLLRFFSFRTHLVIGQPMRVITRRFCLSCCPSGKSIWAEIRRSPSHSLKAACPSPHTASTLAWDPYLIQALGDDPTTLGHSDEGSCDSTDKVHHDGSDSLSESVSDVTLEEPGHLVPVENNSSVTVIPSAWVVIVMTSLILCELSRNQSSD